MKTAENTEIIFGKDERFYLDAQSPVPLYHQMEKVILDRISKPEAINKMIPPEFDLIEIFGVSRATVKKTLDNLVNKGMLERRRGIGTRVIKNQLIEDLARLKSYTEEMESRGVVISTQLLDVSERNPDAYIREKLKLNNHEKTISICRLRGTSEVFPVVLLRSDIVTDIGVTLEDNFSNSLYRLIEQKHRVRIIWAQETIEAAEATQEQAEKLEINPGDPVLIMERISYIENDRPIEFVRAVYRPDRYKFSIRLSR